jgi:hypothetical protein
MACPGLPPSARALGCPTKEHVPEIVMGLVELVLLACLLKEPSHCESFHIPFQAEMNMAQCVWQSQMHAAQWAGEHPEWAIRRFSCQFPQA